MVANICLLFLTMRGQEQSKLEIQKCMNKYTFSMYKYVKWFVSFLIFLSFGRG